MSPMVGELTASISEPTITIMLNRVSNILKIPMLSLIDQSSSQTSAG